MSNKLAVVAIASTGQDIDQVTVDNSLIVTTPEDPAARSMGTVYWRGQRVAGTRVISVSRGAFRARVELNGQKVLIGGPEPIVYDGVELKGPNGLELVFDLTVDYDPEADTISNLGNR